MPKWTEIWWEAPMEGSVLSFLKAEWKVSDTGSAHWASSYLFSFCICFSGVLLTMFCNIYFYLFSFYICFSGVLLTMFCNIYFSLFSLYICFSGVLLTMFSLMMAIDRTYSLYKTEITECIDKLIQIDHKRESYYRDISKNLILFVTHFTL